MLIDDHALIRAIHVLALVHWIGGLAVVTTIVLPHARGLPNAKDAVASFEAFERRFAFQARISILLVGLWLDLIVVVWMLFALMIYVLEPLAIHRLFHEFALRNKDRAFTVAIELHAVAFIISAFAIGAGVLGAHGGLS